MRYIFRKIYFWLNLNIGKDGIKSTKNGYNIHIIYKEMKENTERHIFRAQLI